MQPYEIIAAPFTLWLAPTGTGFPAIDADPDVAWTLVGTNGDRSYSDDGVTVSHSQNVAQARPAGATGPVKTWRTEEDLTIGLTLWDLTLEQYRYALNGAAVSTTGAGAGAAGFKKIGLTGGRMVTPYSALLRGSSSYGDGCNAQYEVPVCYQSGSPKPVFAKGKPAGLALEFTAIEDLAAASLSERLGRLVIQDPTAVAPAILAEDGTFILAEDGSHILTEN